MRKQFYEPEIQPAQASPIRGFPISITGTYVLLDDVITTLREYAQSLPDAEQGALIHELATWLGSSRESNELPVVEDPIQPQLAVDRVEVYPDDPMALKPRWIARACSADGDILQITNGSFDQEYVIQDAQQRWPGKDVHLLAEAGQDSVWEERDPGGIRSAVTSRRRPSPKRLWAGS